MASASSLDDAKKELRLLRETIDQLRSVIRLNPIDKQSGATKATIKQRRELQHELEVSLHRQAELVEANRIEEVARQAVDSGFVSRPFQLLELGECPLCMEEIPEQRDRFSSECVLTYRRFVCCGAMVCSKCSTKYDEAHGETLLAAQLIHSVVATPAETAAAIVADGNSSSNDSEEQRPHCPFCRCPFPRNVDEDYAMERRNAQAGKAWAQLRMGEECVKQWMQSECHNLSAKQEGITWIRKAAEQGDLDAQAALGPLLTNDDDKGLELLQPVARRGHAIAQSLCARYCWSKRQGHDDADAVIWATLAAAQGHVEAYYDLGNYFMEVATATATSSDTSSHRTGTGDDDNGPTDSDFMLCRTLYWYKKAALQAYPPAQAATIQHLIQIKKSLFDGVANQVGYSCLPETVFWNRQAQGDGPRAPFDFEYLLQACGCCGSRPGS